MTEPEGSQDGAVDDEDDHQLQGGAADDEDGPTNNPYPAAFKATKNGARAVSNWRCAPPV